MLTSSVICDAISFFVIRKCQKIQKTDEKSSYWRRKSSSLLNNLRNFNDIFRKDVTYDNIKILKRGLILSLKNTFLEKPEWKCQNEPPGGSLTQNGKLATAGFLKCEHWAVLEISKWFILGGCTCIFSPHSPHSPSYGRSIKWRKREERQLMKWGEIFQVGIFWVEIFWEGIFQGGVWWVEFYGGEVSQGEFS